MGEEGAQVREHCRHAPADGLLLRGGQLRQVPSPDPSMSRRSGTSSISSRRQATRKRAMPDNVMQQPRMNGEFTGSARGAGR
jgi:hypothetical protein